MARNMTAMAGMSGVEAGAPAANAQESLAKMKEFAATHQSGAVLAGEELENVKAWIAAIGCDEAGVSDQGSWQGKVKDSYDVEKDGLAVKVDTLIECKNVWDRTRMEWYAEVGMQKTSNGQRLQEIECRFTYMGFGTNADGEAVLLYNNSYQKDYAADAVTKAFDAGKRAAVSHIDISNNVQWAFCAIVECTLYAGGVALTL